MMGGGVVICVVARPVPKRNKGCWRFRHIVHGWQKESLREIV